RHAGHGGGNMVSLPGGICPDRGWPARTQALPRPVSAATGGKSVMTDEPSAERDKRRFEDLQHAMDIDRIIHEPARLVILAVLSKVEWTDFKFLLTATGLSKGN